MTRRVHKFPLLLQPGAQGVDIPPPGRIRHVHAQNDQPTMWAEVSVESSAEHRTFYVVATGEDVPYAATYVGTVHISWTVWHVFEADG